ncbi:MAG: potassium transporter TrkA, partial [Campylobacterales bacterium]|nr:potassium transporter TrkA [Campylobacterales bacterium]
MISRLITDAAYRINTSSRYAGVKHFFYNLLENSNFKYKNYFDAFMIMLILLSVYTLIIEVKEPLHPTLEFINNVVISFIFLVEYILRLWVTSSISEIVIR